MPFPSSSYSGFFPPFGAGGNGTEEKGGEGEGFNTFRTMIVHSTLAKYCKSSKRPKIVTERQNNSVKPIPGSREWKK